MPIDVMGSLLKGQDFKRNKLVNQALQADMGQKQATNQALQGVETAYQSGKGVHVALRALALKNPQAAQVLKPLLEQADAGRSKAYFNDIVAAQTFAFDDPATARQMILTGRDKLDPDQEKVYFEGANQLLKMNDDELLENLFKAVDHGAQMGFVPTNETLSGKNAKALLEKLKIENESRKAATGEAAQKTAEKAQITAEEKHQLERDKFNQAVIEFNAEQKAGAPAPTGYEWNEAGTELQPITGGPVDRKEKEKVQKGIRSASRAIKKSVVVRNSVTAALSQISMYSTGMMSKSLQKLGGTQAVNMQARLDTITANVAFGELEQMRLASPTGGAVGNVSDTEMKLFGAALGSLDIRQTGDQLKENLETIGRIYTKLLEGAKLDYKDLAGVDAGPQEGDTAANAEGKRIVFRNGTWEDLQ